MKGEIDFKMQVKKIINYFAQNRHLTYIALDKHSRNGYTYNLMSHSISNRYVKKFFNQRIRKLYFQLDTNLTIKSVYKLT